VNGEKGETKPESFLPCRGARKLKDPHFSRSEMQKGELKEKPAHHNGNMLEEKKGERKTKDATKSTVMIGWSTDVTPQKPGAGSGVVS